MSLSWRETTDELTWGQRSCVFQFYTVEFTPSLLYEISSPLFVKKKNCDFLDTQ